MTEMASFFQSLNPEQAIQLATVIAALVLSPAIAFGLIRPSIRRSPGAIKAGAEALAAEASVQPPNPPFVRLLTLDLAAPPFPRLQIVKLHLRIFLLLALEIGLGIGVAIGLWLWVIQALLRWA